MRTSPAGNEKLLMLVSAIDLAEPLGGTLPWWQLFKGLSRLGSEVIVVPFIGKSVESPWWHSYENPSPGVSSRAYGSIKTMKRHSRLQNGVAVAKAVGLERAVIKMVESSWIRQIDRIFREQEDIACVVLFSLPIRVFSRVVSHIADKWSVPVVYFEADMPEVLPPYETFGYNYYADVDLSIFEAFISNSEGVKETVEKLGAKRVSTIHYAIDPEVYFPRDVEKSFDVFFSGAGMVGREQWIERMILAASDAEPNLRVAVSGRWGSSLEGRRTLSLGYLPFDRWMRTVCASRINLNISRAGHSQVYGTSTYRLFELAGLGSAIVSNPYNGVELWYRPDKEIRVLSPTENPVEVYRELLAQPGVISEMSSSALERTMKDHTYLNRAEEMVEILRTVI